MFHLGSADSHCERTECAVGGGVAVPADDGHTWLGQSELRADHVHDALLRVAHGMGPDAEFRAVVPQCLDLDPRYRVGDRLVDVNRRDVVILGGQREVGPAHRTAGHSQPVERLRAGDFVNQVQVDVDQVGLAGRAGTRPRDDDVVSPHLLSEGAGRVGISHCAHLTLGGVAAAIPHRGTIVSRYGTE